MAGSVAVRGRRPDGAVSRAWLAIVAVNQPTPRGAVPRANVQSVAPPSKVPLDGRSRRRSAAPPPRSRGASRPVPRPDGPTDQLSRRANDTASPRDAEPAGGGDP